MLQRKERRNVVKEYKRFGGKKGKIVTERIEEGNNFYISK